MKVLPLLVVSLAGALLLGACGDDEPAGGAATSDVAATDAPPAPSASSAGAASSSVASTAPPTAPPASAAPDLAAELTGRTFVSTAVEGFTLVEGTQIELQFQDGNLGAGGGCNRLSGPWSLEAEVLVVPSVIQTEMACEPPALMDQDTWLGSVLTSRPTVRLEGDTLTISAQGATVTLVDREAADPDRPLEGTVWTVDTLIAGDAASSLPAGARPPTLTFEGGTLSVDTGCNTGSGGYTVGAGTVTFEPIATTRMACVDPAASSMEQHVLAVLTGSATVTIDAGTLTLANGPSGLVARAPAAPPSDATAGTAAPGAPAGGGLVGPAWRLELTTTAGTATPLPALDRIPTLVFDGTDVNVDAGCNTGTGPYTADGEALTFGPLTTTLMLCDGPAGEVETVVLGTLSGAATYAIDEDGALTITKGDSALVYRPS